MRACEHMNFGAQVDVHRLTNEAGTVNGYMADVTIHCTECGIPFQFLGLKPGVDTGGARVSVDGLTGAFALCPKGEQPSALDRIAVNFPTDGRH